LRWGIPGGLVAFDTIESNPRYAFDGTYYTGVPSISTKAYEEGVGRATIVPKKFGSGYKYVSTNDAKSQATFPEFDFVDTWIMDPATGYPVLRGLPDPR
jgi:hypothetical protein